MAIQGEQKCHEIPNQEFAQCNNTYVQHRVVLILSFSSFQLVHGIDGVSSILKRIHTWQEMYSSTNEQRRSWMTIYMNSMLQLDSLWSWPGWWRFDSCFPQCLGKITARQNWLYLWPSFLHRFIWTHTHTHTHTIT
jgi:hypothetical protein